MSSTTAQPNSIKTWVDNNPDEVRDRITTHAKNSGFAAGAKTLMVTGPAAYVANLKWPTFRNRLNMSGKTALVIMPALAAFAFTSESLLAVGAKNPTKYIAQLDGEVVEKEKASTLKVWQRAANHVYDHPYKTLVTISAPLVAAIYAAQHANKNITASQQIMTTRIYGQASVVVLLLSSMAFHDYMSKRGRFEPDESDN